MTARGSDRAADRRRAEVDMPQQHQSWRSRVLSMACPPPSSPSSSARWRAAAGDSVESRAGGSSSLGIGNGCARRNGCDHGACWRCRWKPVRMSCGSGTRAASPVMPASASGCVYGLMSGGDAMESPQREESMWTSWSDQLATRSSNGMPGVGGFRMSEPRCSWYDQISSHGGRDSTSSAQSSETEVESIEDPSRAQGCLSSIVDGICNRLSNQSSRH